MRAMWSVAALLLGVAACERTDDAPSAGAAAGTDTANVDGVAARADRIERPITIEGVAEPMTFRLVRAPDGFPLRFSTYVPHDMDAEFDEIETGHVVNFPARFGGERNDRARLFVHAYPLGTSLGHARTVMSTYLSGLYPNATPIDPDIAYEHGTPVEPASRYPWAQEESQYRLPRGDVMLIGRAGVAEHAGHVFYFLIEYPEAYADGMAPRVAAILDEWRWEDTGTRLGG